MFTGRKFLNYNIFFVMCVMCVSFAFTYNKIQGTNKKNDSLIGKIIYIDAGHGGKDNGASVDNVMEDSINLKISGYLIKDLIDSGAYVLMSRTSDYDLSSLYSKNRKREDLNNRIKYINKSKPDIFISIHLNTYPSSEINGAQVFYQNNEQSKKLAAALQNRLNIFTNKNKKIKYGDYFILNNAKQPGVLIECGFLTNSEERNKLNSDNYQIKISQIIKKGIIDYFNM